MAQPAFPSLHCTIDMAGQLEDIQSEAGYAATLGRTEIVGRIYRYELL
jgi:hypothetical protein